MHDPSSTMIGIFGGTFDPFHLGHLHMARRARDLLCAEIRVVLAARPWHREGPGGSVDARWAMLCEAVEDEAGLVPSDVEMLRSGPSYTVDTLLELRDELGVHAPIVWVIGRDAFDFVPHWHRLDEVVRLCHFLVFDRDGTAPEHVYAGLKMVTETAELRGRGAGLVKFVREAPPPISSTIVRSMMARGENVHALLPPKVRAYIEAHGLYRSNESRRA